MSKHIKFEGSLEELKHVLTHVDVKHSGEETHFATDKALKEEAEWRQAMAQVDQNGDFSGADGSDDR